MLTLPSYLNPPVIEVAAGVAFKPLAIRSIHLGLLWERFKGEFPRYDERPPLPPIHAQGPRVALLARPLQPRLWLMKDDGSELIQVQSDRFIHNWRRIEPNAVYPRYNHVRDHLTTEFALFQEFAHEHGLAQPDLVQIEVTYVNHVAFGPDFDGHGQLGSLLAPWSGELSDSFLPPPDNVGLQLQFPIMTETGSWGHLSVTAAHATRGAGHGMPGYRLTLTAVGKPRGATALDLQEDMELAHVWIVKGFTSVTSEIMHRRWERQ
jgi:uncharacterized protein (TIGR04255 family)